MMDPVQNIGIYGGSFNPVHLGHLIAAQTALEHCHLDRLVFVPCASPPHKEHRSLAPATDRLAMLQAAIAGQPRFAVSDVEMQRGGTSYTVETMTTLRRLHPGAQLFFIIGSDSLYDLHGWKRIDDLLQLCRIVTLLRPGSPVGPALASRINLPPPWPERLLQDAIPSRQIDIASSDIRARAKGDLSIRYLVPDAVADYIDGHRLYADNTEGAASSHP